MNDSITKICKTCKNHFPATTEYFYATKSGKYGISAHCKNCTLAKNKAWRTANPDKMQEMGRRYYAENKEEMSRKARKYQEDNRERIARQKKAYKASNPQKWSEYNRKYREENRERLLEQQKHYREENKEKRYEAHKKWVEKNRERVNQKNREQYETHKEKIKVRHKIYAQRTKGQSLIRSARRRARIRALPDTFTHQDWLDCLEYFHHCCAVCGCQLRDLFGNVKPNADHWIPLNDLNCVGTVPANMICLCESCNKSKADALPQQWLERKYGRRKATEILKRVETYFNSLE